MSHIFSNITMKRIVQRSASRNSCIKCLPKPEAAHCTRRFASFSSGQPHNNNKTNVNSPAAGNWKTNGTPEIIIGATIVALVGIDQILQRYNDDQIQVNKISKKTVMRELEMAIKADEIGEQMRKRGSSSSGSISSIETSLSPLSSSSSTHPLLDINGKELVTLYKCQVMKIPKYFDGTKSLKTVHVNDEVQIMQEFVGPDSSYHLCRIYKEEERDDTKIENKTFIEKLEAKYEYGWFPVSCLKKLQ